jgi:DNA invertase Pin-like site-specific DNA recombinase
VYTIDRLTRSPAAFAKIVEIFDQKGVSFVSVTQQLNTTTSMGRPDPQRAAVLRRVRARGHRRAHSRQGRRLEKERHVAIQSDNPRFFHQATTSPGRRTRKV